MKYEAIVFDFDGVLAESVSIKGDAFVKLYEDETLEIQDKVLRYHNENGGVTRYDKIRYYETELCARVCTEERVQELAQKFSDIVEQLVVQSAWVNGAKEMLEALKEKDTPLYVASATPQAELERIIIARGMEHYFKGIFGAPTKKDQHIRVISAKNGYDLSAMLMVGDAITDYNAAKAAGTDFLGRLIDPNQNPFPEGTKTIPDMSGFMEAIR